MTSVARAADDLHEPVAAPGLARRHRAASGSGGTSCASRASRSCSWPSATCSSCTCSSRSPAARSTSPSSRAAGGRRSGGSTTSLLLLAFIHGANGARVVIGDYVANRTGRSLVIGIFLAISADLARPGHGRHRLLRPVDAPPSVRSRDPRDAGRGRSPVARPRARRGRRRGRRRGPVRGARAEAGPRAGGPHRCHQQALSQPLAHRGGAGRRVRRARQHRGGPLGVALVRHGEGRRLPRRPGRGRGHVPRRVETIINLEHLGLPFDRTERASSTSAASAATPATTARGRCVAAASPPTAPGTRSSRPSSSSASRAR